MSETPKTNQTHVYPPVILSLWQDVWVAISQPGKALKWALQPFRRSLSYLFLLSVILSLIYTAYFFITVRPAIESFKQWSLATVPDITFDQGVLSTKDDQTISFTDSDTFFFKLDPTQTKEDEPIIDSFYAGGILITSDQLIIRDEGRREVLEFSDFADTQFSFSGESITELIDQRIMPLSYLAVPVLIFLYTIIAKLLYTLFFSVFYWFLTGMKYDLVRMWSIALYSLTPAILAGYISFIFGPFFGLYTFVFLIYFSLGLGSLRKFKAITTKS